MDRRMKLAGAAASALLAMAGCSSGSSGPNDLIPTDTVSGRAFEDLDADGDDENNTDPNLSGWEIRAYADTDADGALDIDEFAAGAAASDVTDAGGYSLTIAPGKYIVCEVLRGGWRQSAPAARDDCSAGAELGPEGYAITVTHGDTRSGIKFGNFGPCTVNSVAVSVSSGTTPTFTWTPACLVILLLVEQGATDQWLLEATGDGIASGVTYGTVPAGASADEPATPLQAGTTYEIILFRGPAGSEVMIALEEFTP